MAQSPCVTCHGIASVVPSATVHMKMLVAFFFIPDRLVRCLMLQI